MKILGQTKKQRLMHLQKKKISLAAVKVHQFCPLQIEYRSASQQTIIIINWIEATVKLSYDSKCINHAEFNILVDQIKLNKNTMRSSRRESPRTKQLISHSDQLFTVIAGHFLSFQQSPLPSSPSPSSSSHSPLCTQALPRQWPTVYSCRCDLSTN